MIGSCASRMFSTSFPCRQIALRAPTFLQDKVVSVIDVRRLGKDRYEAFEQSLRPGGESLSGFINNTESLEHVYKTNQNAINELGTSLSKLTAILNEIIHHFHGKCLGKPESLASEKNTMRFGDVTVTQTQYRGFQVCPFYEIAEGCVNERGSRDFLFQGPRGEVTVPELAYHFIEKHKFLEGEVPYRIDLKKICHVFNLSLK